MAAKFATALNISSTWNGAASYASPDITNQASGRLALFFKGVRGLNIPRLYEYLRVCAAENIVDTFVLVFNLRDCRGGKGERELGRKALSWLLVSYPEQFLKILRLIPEYGRWDDLLQFFPKVLTVTDQETVRANFNMQLCCGFTRLQAVQAEVVLFYANQMKQDRNNMLEGRPCTLSSKWAPTEGDSLDSKSDTFKTLANALEISPRTLRQNYNTPLRAYLKVVETFMCTGRWSELNFNKVPSCAMKRLKTAFAKHDPERFSAWQNQLKLGNPETAKVNADQLFPHELVREIRMKKDTPVTEAQWKVLVENTKKLGCLQDTVIVVDTSSSMHSPSYIPLDVAVSLGLIISETVQGSFHGQVITFNEVPEFIVIPDGPVRDRWSALTSIPWGGSTNIEGTFRLILERGKECKLQQEDMPKRIFIVSDMQFNCVQNRGYTTNLENINRAYAEAGYVRPQIVFWNVNGASTDFPATVSDDGTALLSGFSPSLIKAVLEGENFNPYTIMRNMLDSDRYKKVREALLE